MTNQNLWKDESFPHSGWCFIQSYDLGLGNTQLCGMCGYKEIRYVHTLRHVASGLEIETGCVCCDRLSGDEDERKRRERDLERARRAAEDAAFREACGGLVERLKDANDDLKTVRYLREDMRKVGRWNGNRNRAVTGLWNGLAMELVFSRSKTRWYAKVDGKWLKQNWIKREYALADLSEIAYPLAPFEQAVQDVDAMIDAKIAANPELFMAIANLGRVDLPYELN